MEDEYTKRERAVVEFIFSVANLFMIPFVTWKTYMWLKPYTGFELPDMSFWNMFVIRMLVSIFLVNLTTSFSLSRIEIGVGITNRTDSTKIFLTYLIYIILLWIVLKFI